MKNGREGVPEGFVVGEVAPGAGDYGGADHASRFHVFEDQQTQFHGQDLERVCPLHHRGGLARHPFLFVQGMRLFLVEGGDALSSSLPPSRQDLACVLCCCLDF